MRLASSGEAQGDGPLLPPQPCPLLPRDSFSTIFSVFPVEIILSPFPCVENFLQVGGKERARAFLWLSGI